MILSADRTTTASSAGEVIVGVVLEANSIDGAVAEDPLFFDDRGETYVPTVIAAAFAWAGVITSV